MSLLDSAGHATRSSVRAAIESLRAAIGESAAEKVMVVGVGIRVWRRVESNDADLTARDGRMFWHWSWMRVVYGEIIRCS